MNSIQKVITILPTDEFKLNKYHHHKLEYGLCFNCFYDRIDDHQCNRCGSSELVFYCNICGNRFTTYYASYYKCNDNTFDYEKIHRINAIKIQCIIEYRHHPKFIKEFLQDHDMEELDGFEEWMLNRYVCA